MGYGLNDPPPAIFLIHHGMPLKKPLAVLSLSCRDGLFSFSCWPLLFFVEYQDGKTLWLSR